MDLIRERMRACGWHRACGGGESSSDASTNTTNTDKSIVGRDGAQVSGDSNTVYVSTTDHEAVLRGTEIARQALNLADSVGRTSAALTMGVFSAASDSQTKALDKVAGAYETARAGDQRVVKMAAVAVIGLAAVAALGKR